MSEGPLLELQDLTVAFEGQERPVLDRVSVTVPAHGWTGLVGESGSGKSLTSLALLGLLPAGAHVLGGRALLGGRDLLALGPRERRRMRGHDIGMIFQNPRSALNPLMTVGNQIARVARSRGWERPDRAAIDLLGKVRIPDPELRARAYPHQLSGGMCQRVLIAMMLTTRPRLLIADEPTTGLDVTVQAEIFELMHGVQEETGTVVLLISHDLGVIAEHCRQVAVMYGGTVVETAECERLFKDPRHPYTAELMATLLPTYRAIDLRRRAPRSDGVDAAAHGCGYAPRCAHCRPACVAADVRLAPAGPGHLVACIRQEELIELDITARAGQEAG
ncbi:MAG: ABC transporter ATP-binding protein [Candidatus Dormiibacterota bacterium]